MKSHPLATPLAGNAVRTLFELSAQRRLALRVGSVPLGPESLTDYPCDLESLVIPADA